MKQLKNVFDQLLAGWKKFSSALGWVNSRIIFTIIYVVIFGIYALVRRLIRLIVEWNTAPVSATYWEDKKYQPPTIEVMQRQF